jgi:uracil-DNA glycosylase family 4
MTVKEFDKITNFLREYIDIYGEDIFVDRDRISQLLSEMPDLEMAGEQMPKKPLIAARKESPARKPDSPLWAFRDEIKDCRKCPLWSTRTKFVFGDGNEHADIMFIGEAPGAEEDRTGIPFVGRAGQLLNKLLTHINLKREDVFIANILKSRPPNNRDPLPEEIEACIPYLYKQIELIQPKIIVALGRVAAQNLLNTTDTLKQMRGRIWQYRGFDMIVTYHTAAILRNGNLLNMAIEDFKFIMETYKNKLKKSE